MPETPPPTPQPEQPTEQQMKDIQERSDWVMDQFRKNCVQAKLKESLIIQWSPDGARPVIAFKHTGHGTLQECIAEPQEAPVVPPEA